MFPRVSELYVETGLGCCSCGLCRYLCCGSSGFLRGSFLCRGVPRGVRAGLMRGTFRVRVDLRMCLGVVRGRTHTGGHLHISSFV